MDVEIQEWLQKIEDRLKKLEDIQKSGQVGTKTTASTDGLKVVVPQASNLP